MNDSDKEKLIRWEEYRREMLGNVNTLMFAAAGAALAYCGSLIALEEAKFGCWKSIFFIFTVALFAGSLAANLRAAFTRLKDYRLTVKAIREDNQESENAKKWRNEAHDLGEKTWDLLECQVRLFGGGTVCLIITLGQIYWGKLFP